MCNKRKNLSQWPSQERSQHRLEPKDIQDPRKPACFTYFTSTRTCVTCHYMNMTICAGRYSTVSEFNLMTVSWYSLASQGAWNQTFYTPIYSVCLMALMALDHLLHHTSSTGISAGQLGMRIVQGPQTADLGLLPCLAKKKKKRQDFNFGWLHMT